MKTKTNLNFIHCFVCLFCFVFNSVLEQMKDKLVGPLITLGSPNICVKRSRFSLALNSRWQSSSWHTLSTISCVVKWRLSLKGFPRYHSVQIKTSYLHGVELNQVHCFILWRSRRESVWSTSSLLWPQNWPQGEIWNEVSVQRPFSWNDVLLLPLKLFTFLLLFQIYHLIYFTMTSLIILRCMYFMIHSNFKYHNNNVRVLFSMIP